MARTKSPDTNATPNKPTTSLENKIKIQVALAISTKILCGLALSFINVTTKALSEILSSTAIPSNAIPFTAKLLFVLGIALIGYCCISLQKYFYTNQINAVNDNNTRENANVTL